MSEIALEQEELQSLGAGGSLPNAPDTGTNLIDDTTNRGDAGGALQSVDQQKNALEKFIEQPAVKRAAPAVLGLLLVLFCIFFYMWITAPGYRAVYPLSLIHI